MIINLFENLVVHKDKLTRAQPKECRKYLRKIKKKKKPTHVQIRIIPLLNLQSFPCSS